MWTVVHIALDMPGAELARSVLESEGILVRLRPVGVPYVGDSGKRGDTRPRIRSRGSTASVGREDRIAHSVQRRLSGCAVCRCLHSLGGW